MRILRSVVILAVLGLIVASCSIASFAQGGSATVSGRVTDPGGLPVVGARVQAVHIDTSAMSSTQTSDVGFYTIPSLQPGTYRVTVEKEGFQQIVNTGLQLHAADNIEMNFALQVGSVSQSVTVTGEAPVVNTTTSSLGGLVSDEKIADLPLNGRNFIDLSLLQPGISQNKNQGTGGGATGTWFSSNGAPVRSNYVTLDGASMITQMGGSAGSQSGNTLGVDGIKEYRIISHNYGAEYGMTMGSQMVIISKGGTNQFHGTVFEYLRNSVLDAKNNFDTPASAGLTAAGAQRRLPPFVRNNFGGSFGGPIKKDKTFFFANFEGLRQKLGFTANDIVPAGNCHGPANAVITNTQCTQLASVASVTIAPVMAPILALYPYDHTNMNSSAYAAPTTNYSSDNFGQIRFDQNISDKDTFFGRYTIEDGLLNNGSGNISQLPTGTAWPGLVTLKEPNRNQFLTVSETHIFSPTLLNTARLSYSRTVYHFWAEAAPQLTGPSVSWVAGNPISMLQVGGLNANFGVGLGVGPNPPGMHLQNIYTLSDDLFYTHGKHALKFGTLMNRYNQANAAAFAPNGQIVFSSVATFLSGVFANFNSTTQGATNQEDFIYNTFGFYVQDDYRTTSRLTLNLGLRYEFNTTPNNFMGVQGPIQQASAKNYETAPGTTTPGPIIGDKSYYNFSPRFGFAYDVFGNGKTAIRGGFGILYDVGNLGNYLFQGILGLPPFQAQGNYQNPPTQNYVLGTQPNGTPGSPLFTYPTGAAFNSLHTIDPGNGQPRTLQYSVSLEQLLPGNIALSVAYVGTQGKNLLTAIEGNPYRPSSIGSNGLNPVWNPFLCGTVGNPSTWTTLSAYDPITPPSGTPSADCAANPAYNRMNPAWSEIIMGVSGASSWYDALQVQLTKRLGRGLEFQSSYTYSHDLDNTEGEGYSSDCSGQAMENGVNPFNRTFDKGPACWDLRHNWRFNMLYYFPKIQSNGIVSKFVNGWWMGNIVSFQTGYPFSAAEATNRAQSGLFTGQPIYERANINTAASIAANPCTSLPGQTPSGANPCAYNPVPFDPKTVYTKIPGEWVNPAMFSLQPIGTLGNTSRGLLRGPHLTSWDLSLVKDTAVRALGEKGSVQFRAEFFNLPNHTNFGMPGGALFTGNITAASAGPYSEKPAANHAKVTTTATTSRQAQFSLRLTF